jgi:hypothetical protein
LGFLALGLSHFSFLKFSAFPYFFQAGFGNLLARPVGILHAFLKLFLLFSSIHISISIFFARFSASFSSAFASTPLLP